MLPDFVSVLKSENQSSSSMFGPHVISVLKELTLGHLRERTDNEHQT